MLSGIERDCKAASTVGKRSKIGGERKGNRNDRRANMGNRCFDGESDDIGVAREEDGDNNNNGEEGEYLRMSARIAIFPIPRVKFSPYVEMGKWR